MKRIIFFLITFLAAGWIISGCQKVIKLKLGDVPPRYVIEARLSDEFNDCRVVLTMTRPIDEPTVFDGVSQARVTIQEEDKPPVMLYERSAGVYENGSLRATPGHRYTLRVEVKDQTFSSTVLVPQPVPFDSLYIIDFTGFGNTRKFANVTFRDPAGVPNSYRFLQFKNDIQNSNIFIMNDDFSDGKMVNTFLAFFDQSDVQKISSGDTIRVEMQCIDPSVYLYFNSLSRSSTGGNEVSAPGNPVTNIQGGAIGYFNAFARQERTVIVE